MIRLATPATPPRRFHQRAVTATEALVEAYNRGQRDFIFSKTIYGAPAVKAALAAAQHRKCCHCEAVFGHVSFGDVEHYRPKGGFRRTRQSQLEQPGYYWLAYTWDNLLLACEVCNRLHKGDIFPISQEARRARTHLDDLTVETPLIINPREQDPQTVITFRMEYPVAIGGNLLGTTTIRELGLDREPLNERRREHLRLIGALVTIAEYTPALPESGEARAMLDYYRSDAAPFAACTRAFLAQ
jgi:hypothetical protein